MANLDLLLDSTTGLLRAENMHRPTKVQKDFIQDFAAVHRLRYLPTEEAFNPRKEVIVLANFLRFTCSSLGLFVVRVRQYFVRVRRIALWVARCFRARNQAFEILLEKWKSWEDRERSQLKTKLYEIEQKSKLVVMISPAEKKALLDSYSQLHTSDEDKRASILAHYRAQRADFVQRFHQWFLTMNAARESLRGAKRDLEQLPQDLILKARVQSLETTLQARLSEQPRFKFAPRTRELIAHTFKQVEMPTLPVFEEGRAMSPTAKRLSRAPSSSFFEPEESLELPSPTLRSPPSRAGRAPSFSPPQGARGLCSPSLPQGSRVAQSPATRSRAAPSPRGVPPMLSISCEDLSLEDPRSSPGSPTLPTSPLSPTTLAITRVASEGGGLLVPGAAAVPSHRCPLVSSRSMGDLHRCTPLSSRSTTTATASPPSIVRAPPLRPTSSIGPRTAIRATPILSGPEQKAGFLPALSSGSPDSSNLGTGMLRPPPGLRRAASTSELRCGDRPASSLPPGSPKGMSRPRTPATNK